MRLAQDARIAFEAPPPENSPLVGEDLPLAVVYEDKHLIVIDKPAGLVVHPAPGHAAGTLVNALIAVAARACRASAASGARVSSTGSTRTRPGFWSSPKPMRRIADLADLFADHGRTGSLEREYLALVWGGFDAAAGSDRRADRPRSAPSGKDGCRRRGARPPRVDPLAA